MIETQVKDAETVNYITGNCDGFNILLLFHFQYNNNNDFC